MKKMFFAWEKSPTGWNPVVYYDDPPTGKSANGDRPDIHAKHGIVEITPEFIGSHNEPLFGKLQKAYPITE